LRAFTAPVVFVRRREVEGGLGQVDDDEAAAAAAAAAAAGDGDDNDDDGEIVTSMTSSDMRPTGET